MDTPIHSAWKMEFWQWKIEIYGFVISVMSDNDSFVKHNLKPICSRVRVIVYVVGTWVL